MNEIIITDHNPAERIAQETATVLNSKLRERKVLWLIAGGSAKNYYEMMDGLLDEDLDFSNLTIALGDERHDQNINHAGATYPVLADLGVFQKMVKKGATLFNILTGGSIEDDTKRFGKLLEEQTSGGVYILANLGIGKDGHTLGIFPDLSKEEFDERYNTGALAVHHSKGGEFAHRITSTPAMVEKMSRILVYAVGDDKKAPLTKIKELYERYPNKDWDHEIHNIPALLLLSISGTLIITDQDLSE